MPKLRAGSPFTCTASPATLRKPTREEVAMTAADVAGHLGDAIMELTARRKVVDRNSL
jgi:hypothetical protein